jgi:hypothetical protein
MEYIGPFTKLPEYPFVFCNPCEHACIADEVQTHLRRHHRDIDKKERAKIIQAVKSIPGIIHNQTQLRQYPLPVEPTDPVPIIARPRLDGKRCDECPYRLLSEGRNICEIMPYVNTSGKTIGNKVIVIEEKPIRHSELCHGRAVFIVNDFSRPVPVVHILMFEGQAISRSQSQSPKNRILCEGLSSSTVHKNSGSRKLKRMTESKKQTRNSRPTHG